MNEAVAQCTWHVWIDFSNNQPGALCCRLGYPGFDAIRAVTMIVRRADMDHGNIQKKPPGTEEQGDFG